MKNELDSLTCLYCGQGLLYLYMYEGPSIAPQLYFISIYWTYTSTKSICSVTTVKDTENVNI